MSNFKLPTLGRPVRAGDGYDYAEDKIHPCEYTD